MSTVIFQAQFQEAGVALTSGDLVGGDVPTVSVAGYPRNGDPAFVVVAGAAATYYATSKTWRYRNAALDTVLNQYVANFNTTYATADQVDLPALGEADYSLMDLAISSRAAAATALSTAQWTNPRAAALDNLDVAISTRAAPGAAMTLVPAAIDLIWNELLAGHLNAGSTGEALDLAAQMTEASIWAFANRTLTGYPGLSALLSSLVCATVLSGAAVRATVQDLAFERYTTNTVVCYATRSGLALNLTGAALVWVAGEGPILRKSTAAGTITIDPPATGGAFRFTISADESLLFTNATQLSGVRMQCKARLASGEVVNVFEGQLRFDETLIEGI